MQEPKIVSIKPKKLVGMQIETSWSNSQAGILWSQFMPRRKEIRNTIGNDLLAVQVYPSNFCLKNFGPASVFTTRATVEVAGFENVPDGMETYTIEEGLYAVFKHKGATVSFHHTAQYIFNDWLPNAPYEVDDREHFEVLGEKYLGPNNPDSEEEVWIPIKVK